MSEKTIALTGAETEVHFSGGNAWLRNDGAAVVYAAKTAGVAAGADGVISIPAGCSAPVYGANGTVYLLGSGSVQLIGSDYATNPFKTSTSSGGSAVDEVARTAISAHSGNAEIHVTAEEKASWKTTAELMLQAICPSNELVYDNLENPSIMVKVPKMTYAQLGIGDSAEVFPAFIVNGQPVDALYFSKYENVVKDGIACALPAQDPSVFINFDRSIQCSENKGAGWHSMTRLEWSAVALWCLKNGFQPNGNNNYGKDVSEDAYKAVPTFRQGNGAIGRTACGTGPVSWYHNNAADGIADMNGNVWEWNTGVRLVYGELQVLSRDGVTFANDAADPSNSQAENSPLWRAVDGTTGALIAPDGNGTTENSLKLDYASSAWVWVTGEISDRLDSSRGAAFEKTTVGSTVCEAAKRILQALCLYKTDSASEAYMNDNFWANNGAAERCFYSGGYWAVSSGAGIFSVCGDSSRSSSNGTLGFRSAFINPPTV